jgi:hypothetical protein
MKKLKFGLLMLCAVVLIGLCACEAQQTETAVTYDTVSEEEQEVVDFILKKSSVWATDCTGASFTKYDGRVAFAAMYYKQINASEYAGWTKWYYFDVNNATLVEYDSQYRDYSMPGGTYTYDQTWYSSWSQEEKKDYLAQQYDAYLNDN